MKLRSENSIQDIPEAHLHKWLWMHKLQIYEKHFPFPSENTWPSFFNKITYVYIYSFALLQTGIEEVRKLVDMLNKTEKKIPNNKCCFLALVSDQSQLPK